MDDTQAQSGNQKAAALSPDLLKNTPSNIARLADVIEHCEGRQKYLAQTRSPFDGSDVRWYFCKTPLAENELAASVLNTEIVGKSEYFRFGMRDSLAIEASFLEREEELLSLWWKEYAECSEGPRVQQANSKKNTDARSNSSSVDRSGSTHLYEVEEERVGVPVKGGLYEVDLVRRHCFPVYWNGDNRRVLRGHWFARKGGLDWLPIREDVAEQLEVAYRNKVWRRRRFQPSGLFAARVDLQGSSPGLHALFTGENDTWEAWLNVDPSGFSSVVGFSGNGIKLRRGYSSSRSPKPTQEEQRQQKEEQMDDYCSEVPVQHLVFMVHGIGQRLEKSNLVDDVGNFRQITASLAEHNLTSHQRGTQRVLFIPCQWRKGLKLSGEEAVDKCTLDGVRGLRVMLSATVHDVLYYMSPIYCQAIIDSVSNQLNCLYLKFLKRNPGYNGKVSIYGHSLGSVLSYDILCHQENLTSPFPMDYIYNQFSSTEPSDPETNTNLPACQSSEKMGLENSIMSETTEMSSQNDKSMINEELPLLEHGEALGEDFSSVVDTSATDVDLIKARIVDSEPTSSYECVYHHSQSYKVFDNGHDVAESNEHCAPDSYCGSKNLDVEEYRDGSGKDATIESLTEEICSLKARIAELESQRARIDADNRLHAEKAGSPVVPEERVTENLQTEDGGAPKSYTPYVKYTKLEFKVDTFFAVGSPLGVFLALRNIRLGIGKGKDYWDEENITEEMPACRQMFNIFHPFDPVAYRVEPLVCKEYMSKRPVIVPYHKGGRRLHIGFQEFAEDLASRSQAIADRFHTVRVKVLTVCQSRNADKLEDGTENAEEKEERSYGSIMMERLTGGKDGRIDHVLQDKTFEHPYLQTLGAHTNYWRDYDTALFILKHLYRDIPEDPNLQTSDRGSPDNLSRAQSQTDQLQTAEEELPLTFSDKHTVRSFSAKASKFLKKS